jgi:hypothetical protein
MRKKLTILFLIISFCLSLKAQNSGFKFGTRVQLSTGVVLTESEMPDLEVSVGRETYGGLQQSLQVSIFIPVKFFNIGIGAGLSYRTGDVIYPSTLSPKVFLMMEIANGLNRSLLSYILNVGIMQGSIEKKSCFYFGGGPSFNIGKEFKKVNVSINPYWEFHMGEQGIRYYNDPHTIPGYDAIKVPYTLHFRTATVNLSCIIQFNFNRK